MLLRLLSAALLLAALPACVTTSGTSGGKTYNVVAHKPTNPSAVKVKVSLANQMVYVLEGDRPLMVTPTCVGVPGKSTPTGNFRIYSKEPTRRNNGSGFWVKGDSVVSGKNGSAPGSGYHFVGYPMPYWCEFSPAYGFHGGWVWPVPHSHGCLRLHWNACGKFFGIVSNGTPVNISVTQPEDLTIGKNVPRPTDYNDPDPVAKMLTPQFQADLPGPSTVLP